MTDSQWRGHRLSGPGQAPPPSCSLAESSARARDRSHRTQAAGGTGAPISLLPRTCVAQAPGSTFPLQSSVRGVASSAPGLRRGGPELRDVGTTAYPVICTEPSHDTGHRGKCWYPPCALCRGEGPRAGPEAVQGYRAGAEGCRAPISHLWPPAPAGENAPQSPCAHCAGNLSGPEATCRHVSGGPRKQEGFPGRGAGGTASGQPSLMAIPRPTPAWPTEF